LADIEFAQCSEELDVLIPPGLPRTTTESDDDVSKFLVLTEEDIEVIYRGTCADLIPEMGAESIPPDEAPGVVLSAYAVLTLAAD